MCPAGTHHAFDHPPTLADSPGRSDPDPGPGAPARPGEPPGIAGAQRVLSPPLLALRGRIPGRRRQLTLAERQGASMSFSLLEGLNPEAYDRVYTDRQLLRRIARTFRAQTRRLIAITILLVLISVLNTLTPLLISQGIDLWTTTNVLPVLALMVGVILLSTFLSWLLYYFREVITARAVEDIGVQLRQEAFEAVMSRDMSFFDEFPSGSIVSRVTSDTKSFAAMITLALEFFSQVLLFLAVAGLLLWRDVQLALLTLLVMPAIFGVSLGFRRVGRRLIQRSQRSLGR